MRGQDLGESDCAHGNNVWGKEGKEACSVPGSRSRSRHLGDWGSLLWVCMSVCVWVCVHTQACLFPTMLVCSGCHNKIPQTAWLQQQKFPPGSGSRKAEVRVSAGLASSEASLLGLQIATFSLCPRVVFPQWFTSFLEKFNTAKREIGSNAIFLLHVKSWNRFCWTRDRGIWEVETGLLSGFEKRG